MSSQQQKIQANPNEPTQPGSPVKIDKQAIKQKRKKTAALKNFLNDKKSQQIAIVAPPRKLQNQQTQQVMLNQQSQQCKVCQKQVMKKKNCGFCSSIACNDHMRKKRKHPKSGKFVRVCDDCEDKHLFQKYMKLQIKAQQALQLQDMIISQKHAQLEDYLNGKKTKMTLLINKRRQIEYDKKSSQNRLNVNQNQMRNKERKLQSKNIQLDKLEEQIKDLQKNLPRSLEEDYKALTEQNEKITKQLVKYEKMCQEALKAKSKKQKQMYEEYYKWEQKQLEKQQKKQQKKQDCLIY